jgi:hypothetical protein
MRVLQESLVNVLTGALVNYPLSMFFLWLFMDKLNMQDVFWIATYSTLCMTVIAFIRVYWIRCYYDKRSKEEIC